MVLTVRLWAPAAGIEPDTSGVESVALRTLLLFTRLSSDQWNEYTCSRMYLLSLWLTPPLISTSPFACTVAVCPLRAKCKAPAIAVTALVRGFHNWAPPRVVPSSNAADDQYGSIRQQRGAVMRARSEPVRIEHTEDANFGVEPLYIRDCLAVAAMSPMIITLPSEATVAMHARRGNESAGQRRDVLHGQR